MVNLAFWGKAQPGDVQPDGPSSHPLAYHLLDVAACVREILAARPRVRATAARLLLLSETEAVGLLVALAALHDLGKCAPKFQVKSPEHWPAALGLCDPVRDHRGHHTKDGITLWNDALGAVALPRLWLDGEETLRALASAVFGHHGRPVGTGLYPESATRALSRTGLAEALTHADALLTLLHPRAIERAGLSSERAALASWWVAGLMTLADWIGSNTRWFPYTAPFDDDPTLERYWTCAGDKAASAIRQGGLETPRVAPPRTFAEISGRVSPTPTQRWAETVELPSGALLAIIEDVTGAGKTEAAQMLVHRLMTSRRASGAYWAMPTQATANAMYERQAKLFDRLFEPTEDRQPSLVLAHGQQRLHSKFRKTVLGADVMTTSGASISDEDAPSSAWCSAFLADDRRRALLADIGAGTVDQALLGILPSRFNSLRLFALADKVIVVDEAHAYDAYMGVEVRELLRFHAALGGSAIVLSATLSAKQRERTVSAWMDGLNDGRRRGSTESLTASAAYPLATLVSGDAEPVREEPLQPASWSRRSVRVRMVATLADAVEHVVSVHRRGAAVAWVRNTVDDCLAAADALRARGLDPFVFHARFAQGDRQRREQEVLALFGEKSTTDARRGKVLVATQVIEQSLDLDFDAMVSDVAPIDLLVQRAGRLWRHPGRNDTRPLSLHERALVVLAPPMLANPPKDWLGGIFAGSAYVYGHAGVLWRTVKVLSDLGVIDTPDGLRGLIGAVYDSEDELPPGLLASAQRAEGKASALASMANYAVLKVTDGYDAGAQAWVSDLRAPTRLGDEQSVVRLARVLDDVTIVPWERNESEAWKAWALSEVRLSRWKVPPGSTAEPRFAAAVEAAKTGWGVWEQDRTVLPLSEVSPGAYVGALVSPDGTQVRRMAYDSLSGIMYPPDKTREAGG